jgi:hypothetical protein
MKIVIEVSDESIANCQSLDQILELFVHELKTRNNTLYTHIFNKGEIEGRSEAWGDLAEQYENYHCPSCDGHRCDDDQY